MRDTEAPGRQPDPATNTLASADQPEVDCGRFETGEFFSDCKQELRSPDERLSIISAPSSGPSVVRLADNAILERFPQLFGDLQSFDAIWSPASDAFLANIYEGSSQETLHVFRIVNGRGYEVSNPAVAATEEMIRRYPCLGRGASVQTSGFAWLNGGRSIALAAYTRPDACAGITHDVGWEPLWMIADARTGVIERGSVRVRTTESLPVDGPYGR